MKLEKLQQYHSPVASEFFESFPVRGLLQLKYDRKGDFFAPYRFMGDRSVTYSLKDTSEQKIAGIASFVFQNLWVNNEMLPVAWARDLRVSNQRAALLNWAYHFVPVLEEVFREHQVQSVLSAINLQDLGNLKAFLRPRPLKRMLPRYFQYRKFDLVSLHGQFPWAHPPLESVRIETLSSRNYEQVLEFVLEQSRRRNFSEVHDAESFQRKLQRLGILEDNFFIAKDRVGRILGSVAHWSSSEVEDWIPLSYSLRAHNFRQFLKFFWLLGCTRRLSKPVRSTGFESPLRFRRLSFVYADHEDIFESLLWSAFRSCRQEEFLLYAHAEHDIKLKPPPAWVSARIPHALYVVVPPNASPPDFLNPKDNLLPEVESVLI